MSETVLLHAGDALARHVINETFAALDDQFHPIRRRGRRDEIDRAQAGSSHQRLVIPRLFRRKIEHEQPIDSRGGGGLHELGESPLVQQVEIDVEDDRNAGRLADSRNGLQ